MTAPRLRQDQEHHKQLCWRFSLHEINKNMQRKPVVQGFYICVYDVTYIQFKTFHFITNYVKTDQNAAKLYIRLFLHKVNKNNP